MFEPLKNHQNDFSEALFTLQEFNDTTEIELENKLVKLLPILPCSVKNEVDKGNNLNEKSQNKIELSSLFWLLFC